MDTASVILEPANAFVTLDGRVLTALLPTVQESQTAITKEFAMVYLTHQYVQIVIRAGWALPVETSAFMALPLQMRLYVFASKHAIMALAVTSSALEMAFVTKMIQEIVIVIRCQDGMVHTVKYQVALAIPKQM